MDQQQMSDRQLTNSGKDYMKLKQLASNTNELVINGKRILISYETPVATITECVMPNGGHQVVAEVTDKKWSRTTSKHINKWFCASDIDQTKAIKQDQSYFDNLLNEVK